VSNNEVADFDLKSLYLALDAQRQARGLTWSQAMLEINLRVKSSSGRHPIAHSTISGLRSKTVAEGDGVLQMLRWLDRSPESFVPGFPASDIHGLPEVAPDRVLRFDTPKLYTGLDARRTDRGLTWTQVAREIGGTSPNSLTHLKKGGRTGFPGVLKLARWLDRPVRDFVRITSY
jgi:hypothetical protein